MKLISVGSLVSLREEYTGSSAFITFRNGRMYDIVTICPDDVFIVTNLALSDYVSEYRKLIKIVGVNFTGWTYVNNAVPLSSRRRKKSKTTGRVGYT